jgi:hypothetical protein
MLPTFSYENLQGIKTERLIDEPLKNVNIKNVSEMPKKNVENDDMLNYNSPEDLPFERDEDDKNLHVR